MNISIERSLAEQKHIDIIPTPNYQEEFTLNAKTVKTRYNASLVMSPNMNFGDTCVRIYLNKDWKRGMKTLFTWRMVPCKRNHFGKTLVCEIISLRSQFISQK